MLLIMGLFDQDCSMIFGCNISAVYAVMVLYANSFACTSAGSEAVFQRYTVELLYTNNFVHGCVWYVARQQCSYIVFWYISY